MTIQDDDNVQLAQCPIVNRPDKLPRLMHLLVTV